MYVYLIGDYIAVSITEDKVFGTPIFTTVGGQSKCPGETMTTKREADVQIVEVVYKCGESHPRCTGLERGVPAVIGVRIQNLSPSGNWYTLL